MKKLFFPIITFFANLNVVILFILMFFLVSPVNISFSSVFPDVSLKIAGGTVWLFWMYAIAYISYEKYRLNSSDIFFFNLLMFIVVLSFLLSIILVKKTESAFFHNTYIYKPLIIPLTLLIAQMMTVAIAGRLLVSAEKGHPAKFKTYFTTSLQIFFFPIGVWFIQPRIQKLLKNK